MSDPLREVEKEITTSMAQDPTVRYWQSELELAKKRDKPFWEKATRVVRLYEGEKHDDNSFNILYANTETLLPACYNQLPRPFVDRRFHDADPLAKLGAQCLERTLACLEDSGDAQYEAFTELMEYAVLGALIPGRGLTWFKYDAKITASGKTAVDDKEAEGEDRATTGSPGGTPPAGQVGGDEVLDEPGEKVDYETVCGEDVDYDHILFGFARRWVNTPWIAKQHKMTREDVEVSFGEEWIEKLKFTLPDQHEKGLDYKKNAGTEEEAQRSSQPICIVWEIWNKPTKKVLFYSPTYLEGVIKEVDDPLQLSGFFPCPEPLRFLKKRSKQTPTPIYSLYEEQAKELNRVTMRINRLVHALKVRGFYDSTIKGLKELLNSDDNTLLPAKDVAGLTERGTLENSIQFVPTEQVVAALKMLWEAREQTKNTIYEITGIADIMRGEGEASATATQERIKNQWGTLRLQRMQRYVQEYVRQCLRIMGEIAAQHFSIDTFAEMTNLDFAKSEDIKKAQKTLQYVQQMQQQMQMQASMVPPPIPGAPPGPAPAPPQLPPQIQQMAQQAQSVLAKPPWDKVVDLLRDDVSRYYRIDIETNSTIASDTQEDKENMTEALGAITGMFQTMMEPVQAGALPMPAFKAILGTVVRKFQFGREVEDALQSIPDKLPPPPPPPGTPTPEELQAIKDKATADSAKAQSDAQQTQLNMTAAAQTHQMDLAKMDREAQADAQEHAFKVQASKLKIAETSAKLEMMPMEMQLEREKLDAEREKVGHQLILSREQAALASKETEAKGQEIEHKKQSNTVDLDHKRRMNAEERDNKKKLADQERETAKEKGQHEIELTKKKAAAVPPPAKEKPKSKEVADTIASLREAITLLKARRQGSVPEKRAT